MSVRLFVALLDTYSERFWENDLRISNATSENSDPLVPASVLLLVALRILASIFPFSSEKKHEVK